MECLVVTKSGQVSTKNLERKDIVHEFDVHLRDLRPVFSSKQLVTISPRGEAIIVNLGVLKLVIGKDKVYLFNTQTTIVEEEFIPTLVEALTNNEEKIAFEFRVLETALHFRFMRMKNEFEKLEKEIERALSKVQRFLDEKSLEKLLELKKRLLSFVASTEALDRELDDVLSDEEEMKGFYLSLEVPQDKDYEEIESVLENNAELIEDLGNRAELINDTIDHTQDFISLKLSNRRNLIIRFDLLATLVTAVFSFLAVITGIYGMNLRNNAEDSFLVFLMVIFLLAALGTSSCLFIWWYLKKNKIL